MSIVSKTIIYSGINTKYGFRNDGSPSNPVFLLYMQNDICHVTKQKCIDHRKSQECQEVKGGEKSANVNIKVVLDEAMDTKSWNEKYAEEILGRNPKLEGSEACEAQQCST